MIERVVAEKLQKQRDFFETNITKDPGFRFRMLEKLKRAIDKYELSLINALKEDLGKSPFEAYISEIGIVKNELSFQLKHLRSWSRPRKVKTPLYHLISRSFICPEPYGLVLIIAPWNYPFNLLFTPLVGALAAGNCVVLKPSNHSPVTSALMEKLINETFDEHYVSIFQGGREMIQALLREKFDYIFFSGSPAVGKVVMEAASSNLTPVTLELGGKCPCIVDSDARIKRAGKRIAWGKFLNAGQSCIAPDYLLVNRDVKHTLLEALKESIKEFYGDNPEQSPDYGRIINQKHFDRLCNLMKKGEIIFGGKTKKESRYISPTIIDGVSPEDPIMQEEIFGPLLPVVEFISLDEAISYVRERPKPLSLYFFSESREKQERVLQTLSFGGGCINDVVVHFASPYLPFGGIGTSGMGSYHGRASFETFTHKKSILKKSNLFDLAIRYAPYGEKLRRLKRFLK